MSTPPLPLRATDELVAAAWIASIPGLNAGMVGSQVPPDANADGTPASWVTGGLGFVTLQVVGGNPSDLLPLNATVFQVDCVAVVPGSGKPPWGVANALCEAIKFATWDRRTLSRKLTPVNGNAVYPTASVQGARMVTAFRRSFDDAGDYARYQGDLWLQWIQLDDVLT